jgi:hypothetical protein
VFGNRNFYWNHLPSGRRDSINLDLFDVIAWDVKNYSVSVVARNKIMDVVVRITIVYGYPYEEKRMILYQNYMDCSLIWIGLQLLVVILI